MSNLELDWIYRIILLGAVGINTFFIKRWMNRIDRRHDTEDDLEHKGVVTYVGLGNFCKEIRAVCPAVMKVTKLPDPGEGIMTQHLHDKEHHQHELELSVLLEKREEKFDKKYGEPLKVIASELKTISSNVITLMTRADIAKEDQRDHRRMSGDFKDEG